MTETSSLRFQNIEFVTSATKPSQYPAPLYPEVAVLGRSNVGKSSLLNSLFSRRNLVKVSRTPGRTQLINFFSVDQQMLLVDLPGYGFAQVPERIRQQWRPMIEKYLEQRKTLVGYLFLLDIRRDPSEDDLDLWEWLCHYDATAIPVLTKADKLSTQQAKNQCRKIADALDIPEDALVLTSAKTHAGRDRLRQIIQSLCWVAPEFAEEATTP